MRTPGRKGSLIALTATIGIGLFVAACDSEDGGERLAASCPVEGAPQSRPGTGAVAFAYGDGPAFVGLGTPDGIVRYAVDTKQHDGWHYYKTLWAIAPGYSGMAVITGEQVGGSQELRFNPSAQFPGEKQLRLRFPPDDSGKWRYGPSDTLIRAPGCYEFDIEGEGFRESITFEARD